nr:unnamed protein product [Callosobruchus chinensis]
MYWENSNDGGNKLVSSAISRDRFNFVTQNLHLNDNNDLEQNDKFSKLRPLFLILNEKFISLAPFEECHSVDESMVPYYGGHNGGAPFHIFCDNFFTSLPLLTELSNRGMKCTGTVRENRLPDCLLQKSTSFKKKIRGTFVIFDGVGRYLMEIHD